MINELFKPMKSPDKVYSEYVEHPRFGQSPRFTHADPDPTKEKVCVSWWSPLPSELDLLEFGADDGIAIEGTAIPADIAAQKPMMFQFTHYYDVDRKCLDCGRRFIFFAEEQKFWYETLQFYGGVNCLHCIVCRKKRQHLDRARLDYQELKGLEHLNPAQTLQLIESGITLIEAGVASEKCRNHLRHLARLLPPEVLTSENTTEIVQKLWPPKVDS